MGHSFLFFFFSHVFMAAKSRVGCIIKVWIDCQKKPSAVTHMKAVGIY